MRLPPLAKMVDVLLEVPSIRALEHVIRTYLRLCDNPTARAVFKQPETIQPCGLECCQQRDVWQGWV